MGLCPSFVSQLKTKLTMEKVYLALDMVGLSAEKTKLEKDFREGASQLKLMEVRGDGHGAPHRAVGHGGSNCPVCSCSKNAASWSRGNPN